MAFVYCIPIMIYDQRETLHPGDDPIHYLYGDADHRRGAERPVVPHNGEQAEKGGFQVTTEKHNSCNLDSWMQIKNILSPIIPLPEWALILKKKSQENKYIQCANTQLP